MDFATELRYTTNLDSGVQMTPLKNSFLSGDQDAHRFIVSCFRSTSRQPVDLTGAGVTGYFIRADQSTVVIDGKVEDNCAVLTLPAACYAKEGRFSLVIKASMSGVIHTILWAEGAISQSHTGAIIDPGEVVPTLDKLLAQIAAMEIATNNANQAAETANQAATDATNTANAAATQAVEIATAKGDEALKNVANAVKAQDNVIDQQAKKIELIDNVLFEETELNLYGEEIVTYPYPESTFSGWVSEYTMPTDFAIKSVTVHIKARDVALTKCRIVVALDAATDANVVFDSIFDIDVQPEEATNLTFDTASIFAQSGQTVYIAAMFDAICTHGFGMTNYYMGVTKYETNGKLDGSIENFSSGANRVLVCYVNGQNHTNNRVDETNNRVDETNETLQKFKSAFDIRDNIENVQDLIPYYQQVWSYTSSTFTGWAAPIGKASHFDTLVFKIRNRTSNTAPLDAIRCCITVGDKAGQVLADKTIAGWQIAPGEERTIYFPIGNTIENADGLELYASFSCDNYIDLWTVYTNVALVPPTYGNVAYCTASSTGVITLKSASAFSNVHDPDQNNAAKPYMCVGVMQETVLLSDSQIEQVKGELSAADTTTLRVILPDKFQAVVGDTLQLFFRGIVEHPNPYIYNIEVICPVGKSYARYFELTPTSGQIGNHRMIVNVRDSNDTIIGTAETMIEVVALGDSPENEKTVLCVGDSLTASGTWCAEAYRRLTGEGGTPAGNGLDNITFIGSKNNGAVGFEGNGGWTWGSYLREPSTTTLDMWVYCTHDKTTADQHSLWTDPSGNIWQLETIEANRLKFTRYEGHTGQMPTGAGAMQHRENATHTAQISYTDTVADGGNPFWDSNLKEVNFQTYCQRHGFSGIDYMYTLLTWNGNASYRANAEDHAVQVDYAKTLLRILHEQFPNAKVKVMGIQMPSLNGGTGENYGANSDYSNAYGLCRSVMGLNLAYQAMANDEEFAGWVEFVNVSAQFDSENNMPQTSKAVNTRSSKTELVGTNGVHPTVDGYKQIGDAAYRNMVARLTF